MKISKGMNRNRIKLDLFKEFDEVTKATIFASISGTFGSRTNNDDKLYVLDLEKSQIYGYQRMKLSIYKYRERKFMNNLKS